MQVNLLGKTACSSRTTTITSCKKVGGENLYSKYHRACLVALHCLNHPQEFVNPALLSLVGACLVAETRIFTHINTHICMYIYITPIVPIAKERIYLWNARKATNHCDAQSEFFVVLSPSVSRWCFRGGR